MQNKEQIWQYLSAFPKGESRREALENIDWTPIITTGANVTLYCKDKKGICHVLLINRQKKDGTPDGVGALGGLSEYIEASDFEKRNNFHRYHLIGKKDNVILNNKRPIMTTDIDIICRNTVLREMKEELGNLNIVVPNLPWDKMCLVSKSDYDADFLIHHWEGEGSVFVVKAYCYALLVDEKIIDDLLYQSQRGFKEQNSELSGMQKVPAMIASTYPLGRGENNYRYLHEQQVCHQMAENEKMSANPRLICSSYQLKIPFLGHGKCD